MSKINRSVVLTVPIFLLGLAIVTWQVVDYGQQRTLEYQALEIAEIIARQAASARTVYTREVVEKLQQDNFGAHRDSADKSGYVPLAAQFLKLLGKHASSDSDGLFRYQPISKWNLEPSQGLDDDFERWAWSELEKQDQEYPVKPIDWRPVWRLEDIDGVTTLRYMRADPAVNETCVGCHNAQEYYPETIERRRVAGLSEEKQWRQHQLLGAIQVTVPLDKIVTLAAEQTGKTTIFLVLVFTGVLLAIAFFAIRDLLRTQQAADEMTWRANHDDLTGLASRLAFEHRAEELLNRCLEDNSTHALLFMDLDQFKIVNDTCGHIAGDELLCEIAKTMSKNVRSSDMLARLGGDEFGVLLEGCDIDNAYDCAEKLRKAIRELRFTKGNRKFEIGVSIGLVAVNNNCDDVTSVLSLADLACYTAKDEGRNRIKVYSDSDTQIDIRHEEMEWASRFNRAIDENRIKLAVQHCRCLNPEKQLQQYSEVLLRMEDGDGNPVQTAVFIGAAERYHFMPTIDRWVVKTVLSMIKNQHLPLEPDQIIAINLSGLSVNEDDFLEYVEEQFKTYNEVPPGQICFEITETAAIGNISSARRFITSLQKVGCQFALDDFGSGLSSFTYLKNLPIDYLKIEGGFVKDMVEEPLDKVVVEAICLIGKRLDVATIAEWVENEQILQAVQQLGIDHAQGFGIHKPELIDISNITDLQPVLRQQKA